MSSAKASAAACIAPLRVASQSIRICQAVCHPLSGGSVACLVCASPHFTQATAPYARSLPCQCFAFQRNAVQCLAIHFHCTMKKECAMKVFQARIALKILSMQNSFAQGKVRRTDIASCRALRGCKARMRRNKETGYTTNSATE